MAGDLLLCVLTDSQGNVLYDSNGDPLIDEDCTNPYADQIADSIDVNGTFILQGVDHQERLDRMFGILFGTVLVTSQAQADILGIRIRGSVPVYYRP